MSDSEDVNYENFGIPTSAGDLKIGGHVIINSRPCKIVELTKAKSGKHGVAKAHFYGIDIFTNRKYVSMCSTGHNVYVPEIVKKDYQVSNVKCDNVIDLDGIVEVLDDKGETLEFLLPDQCGSDKELAKNIIDAFNNTMNGSSNKVLYVNVIKSVGEEHIKGYRLNDLK
jgi:translation initiation factor 5A